MRGHRDYLLVNDPRERKICYVSSKGYLKALWKYRANGASIEGGEVANYVMSAAFNLDKNSIYDKIIWKT